jgi:prepilin-type N-terminal cleavage/methylation domain-containing protein
MRKQAPGFTLLELMVSLTLMGIIAAIIFGALHLGISSWERGNQIVDSAQEQIFAWHLVSRQIRSACPFRGEGNSLYFRGDKSEISFVSAYSLHLGDQSGLVRVIYRIVEDQDRGKTRLLVHEEPVLDKKRLEEEVDNNDFIELMETDEPIFFSFEKAVAGVSLTEEDSSSWEDHWEGTEQSLPLRVKISRELGDKESEDLLVLSIFAQGEKRR